MSPRQNRVLPTGEIVATAERGLFMGNRGILHDANGRLGVSRWRHPHWVCCRLAFKGRARPVMSPGAYTELFFLDEAVALAAGHRPCAECRRSDYERFRDHWAAAFGTRVKAGEMDAALQGARVRRNRSQVRHGRPARELPDGAFFLDDGRPMLVAGGIALPFAPGGYGRGRALPEGDVSVLTPQPTLAILSTGFRPVMHPTAAL